MEKPKQEFIFVAYVTELCLELSFQAPAARLLPPLKGFRWTLLPRRSGRAICRACTLGVYYGADIPANRDP